MHPADIQSELKKKGLTQKALAEKIGRHPVSVGDVISGHRISDYIMESIADAIGKDKRRVFPDYYNQHPKRKTSKCGPI